MEALEAIRTRRSIRRYKHEVIPKEHLETIVDAARRAPSAENAQPWKFVVVDEKNTRARRCGVAGLASVSCATARRQSTLE